MGQRKLPKQELARASREPRIENLAVLAVRPIKADLNIRSPIPFLLAIVIQSEMVGPAVVSRPGRARALEQKIGSAGMSNDAEKINLHSPWLARRLPHGNTPHPVSRNVGAQAPFP